MIVVKVEEWKDGYRDNARILSELHIHENVNGELHAVLKDKTGKPVNKLKGYMIRLWETVAEGMSRVAHEVA